MPASPTGTATEQLLCQFSESHHAFSTNYETSTLWGWGPPGEPSQLEGRHCAFGAERQSIDNWQKLKCPSAAERVKMVAYSYNGCFTRIRMNEPT